MKKYNILKTKDNTKIKIIQLGNGSPSVLLMAGVHGDEKTGPIILRDLSKKLASQRMYGKVNIVTIANPKAYKANQRIHPNDHQDLNRNFPPANGNTPTNNLAKILASIVMKQNLVIDLHTFPNQISPIVGVSLCEGNKKLQKQSNKLLKLAKPNVVWLLDTKKTEPQKGGSICSFALQNNITAFGLELPPVDLISQSQINRVIKGLLAVLADFNIINLPRLRKKEMAVPAYERQIFKNSIIEGLFVPKKKVLTPIDINEPVGIIKGQQNLVKKIYSPYSGILLTISKKRMVKKNEKLFVVGKKLKIKL
jgi:predicted deacylase